MPMPELHRHRHPAGAAARTAARTIAAQQRGPGRDGGTAALAGDLRRGAPEVEVDVVDAVVAGEPGDGLADVGRVDAVELQAPRPLVGAEGDHARRCVSLPSR